LKVDDKFLTYLGNQKYEPVFNSHHLTSWIYFYTLIFSILNNFVKKNILFEY